MKLLELHPSWKRYKLGISDEHHGKSLPDGTIQWGGFEIDILEPADVLAEAHGIWFDCPKCFTTSKHGVLVWFVGSPVPEHMGLNSQGKPVRWKVKEDSMDFTNLTLTPSILLQGGCGWHGFVTNGEAS